MSNHRFAMEFMKEAIRRATKDGILDKIVCDEFEVSARRFRRWRDFNWNRATYVTPQKQPCEDNDCMVTIFPKACKALQITMFSLLALTAVTGAIAATDDEYLVYIAEDLTTEDEIGRFRAVVKLANVAKHQQLPPKALEILTHSAQNDSHLHIRLDIFKALKDQVGIDWEALSKSLAKELTHPTQDIWQASQGRNRSIDRLEDQTIQLLMSATELPYPDYLIDALISQSAKHFSTTHRHLVAMQESGQLTTSNRKTLYKVAGELAERDRSTQLYNFLNSGQSALTGEKTIEESFLLFAESTSQAIQIQSGDRLLAHYQKEPIPASKVATASRLVLDSNNIKVRRVAAQLIAQTDNALNSKADLLLLAIKRNPHDQNIRQIWIELFGSDYIEPATRQYVADNGIFWPVRSALVNQLVALTPNTQPLTSDTLEALITAGSTRGSYSLNSAIRLALMHWKKPIPFSVTLHSETFQQKALQNTYVLLGILFLLGSIANLIFLFARTRNSQAKTATRSGLVLLWVCMTVGGGILFIIATTGFLSHGSAPPPDFTFYLNSPMYVGMIAFLVFTYRNYRRAQK